MIFITGTDTHIGKTVVSSWLCMHLGFSYFKPIQTGTIEGTDSDTVKKYSPDTFVYSEAYTYRSPVSPHFAAAEECRPISFDEIRLPIDHGLIVEGAGGLLVPINPQQLMIDLIQYLEVPVVLVASTRLGTINHTLLSLEALNARQIPVLGVILNGPLHQPTAETIAYYGKTNILAQIPPLERISTETLSRVKPSDKMLTTLRSANVFN